MSDFTLNWRGKLAKQRAAEAGDEALTKGCKQLLSDSKRDCPKRDGTLARSGTFSKGALPDSDAVYASALAGVDMAEAYSSPLSSEDNYYVSFHAPYAEKQHEDLTLAHPNGGKAKFLEDNFNASVGKILKSVADAMNKELSKR